MSKGNFARIGALGLAAALGVACSSKSDHTARNENTSATERTAGETGRATDDTAITTRVKTKLASENRLASLKEIDVSTDNGVVTLKGTVPNENDRKDAEQMARSVDGVTDVKNDIKVEKAATAKNERHHRAGTRDTDRNTQGDNTPRGDNTGR